MQQQGRRFSDTPQQQPVYRFPQNQTPQGWQPQQTFSANQGGEMPPLSKQDKKELKRIRGRRRRIFTLWNLFAVIGMICVFVQAARYIVIPLLVQLNILTGGKL